MQEVEQRASQFQQTNTLPRDTRVLLIQIKMNCFLVICYQSTPLNIQAHYHCPNITSSSSHRHTKYRH